MILTHDTSYIDLIFDIDNDLIYDIDMVT